MGHPVPVLAIFFVPLYVHALEISILRADWNGIQT
jgi:hypothetical protein